ncbi:MAG: ATP-grasp domain-containing protein [Clostridiaceae bacterium]
MKQVVNVLIFPAGSVSAINIYDSLKYNPNFNVFGASAKADHAEFIYPQGKLFSGNLFITQKDFIDEFNKVIEKFKIDYIIPTHDTVALFLARHCRSIKAELICSPYKTAKIAENKKLTCECLKDLYFYPKVYNSINEITNYPVFLKPYVGAGGKGTYLVTSKEDLKVILKKNPDLLISEYLPGREYTVDCFTNKDGELLFAGARTRERITIGITFHSVRTEPDSEFKSIAEELNNKLKFRGAWFFQVKEDGFGNLKLMEFSVRQAGTMAFYRQLGINFAALSVFDAMGRDLRVVFNDYKLILDRTVKSSYRLDYQYEILYIDLDETLIVNGNVNTDLMKLIYQSVNANKKVVLLTKHPYVLDGSLRKYRINKDLFDEIILLEPEKEKAEYIAKSNAVFIDNSFAERILVKEICNIPVFDVDAVECLIDSSAI